MRHHVPRWQPLALIALAISLVNPLLASQPPSQAASIGWPLRLFLTITVLRHSILDKATSRPFTSYLVPKTRTIPPLFCYTKRHTDIERKDIKQDD